ncbi:MAG: DUF2254 domain-containing protein [Myxococcales bacterium]|nr:DUF2254 domain-containing protein [Myxococcales bacterium]
MSLSLDGIPARSDGRTLARAGHYSQRGIALPVATWSLPFLAILAIAALIFLSSFWLDLFTAAISDAEGEVTATGLLHSVLHQDLDQARNTLGGLGEVMAAVLGLALTVSSIIVQLAATRFTPHITSLFFRARTNLLVLGFFVTCNVYVLWVNFSVGDTYLPRWGVLFSMLLMTASLLLLFPYFAYVFDFLDPEKIVGRIMDDGLAAATPIKGRAAEAIDALRSPRECDEPRSVIQRTPLPDDPALRAQVERVRRAVIPLRTLRDAGHYARARRGLEPLEAEARGLGYDPLSAELAYELGVTLSLQGEGAQGARLVKDAAQRAAGARHDVKAAEAWIQLVHTTSEDLHDYAGAREHLEHARVAVARLGQTELARSLQARLRYYEAVLAWREGRHDEAMALYADAIAQAQGVDPELVANATDAKGILHVELGQHAEALAAFQEVLRRRKRLHGDHHPNVAEAYANLATVHFHAGRHREALEQLGRSEELKRSMLGAAHPSYALDLHLHAQILAELEQFDQAAELAAQARRIMEQARGPDHVEVATMLELEGSVLLLAERSAQAAERLRAALEVYGRTVGDDSTQAAGARLQLAQAWSDEAPEEAAALGLQVIEQYLAIHGEGHIRVTNARAVVGELLLDAGHPDQAWPLLDRALRDLDPDFPVGHRGALRFLLARTLLESGADLDAGRQQLARASDELDGAGESFAYARALLRTWRDEHPALAAAGR